jgi:hypothetical protein
MLTCDELAAIRRSLLDVRERLADIDDDCLVEVQWLRDAEWDITSLLAAGVVVTAETVPK